MPDKTEPSPRRRIPLGRRGRRVSAVPREIILGLDNVERGVSLIAGAIAMVLTLVITPHLFKNSIVTNTAKPSSSGVCTVGFHLVLKLCQRSHITHPSDWLPQFLEIFVIGLFIIYFALRRKRAGVAVSALLLGLALGVVGLPFLMVGGWLVIRALRLQKYGDATFSGSSQRARQLALEKKQGRTGAARTKRKSDTTNATPTPPAPSKRYTPKQRPRHR